MQKLPCTHACTNVVRFLLTTEGRISANCLVQVVQAVESRICQQVLRCDHHADKRTAKKSFRQQLPPRLLAYKEFLNLLWAAMPRCSSPYTAILAAGAAISAFSIQQLVSRTMTCLCMQNDMQELPILSESAERVCTTTDLDSTGRSGRQCSGSCYSVSHRDRFSCCRQVKALICLGFAAVTRSLIEKNDARRQGLNAVWELLQ